MAKLLALGAYVYQALIAFGLLLLVARLLPPADYATYSVFLGLTQLGAFAGFEWLYYACSRFYPGQTEQSERDERSALVLEGLVTAGICLLLGAVAAAFGLNPILALGGGAIAAAQGGTDLHLSIARFGQRFRVFSRLNAIRATILAIGTLAGAMATHDVRGMVLGIVGAYVVYGIIAVIGDRKAYRGRSSFRIETLREHVRYGGVSAVVAVLGLMAPLGLKLILTSVLGKEASAGVLLALDLLQRPFIMIIAALQAVEYPDVVAAFDRKVGDFPQRLGRYYALMTTLMVVAAAAMFVALRLIAEIFVSPALRDGFVLTAPLVTIFSMLRALTQNIAATPAHLQLNLRQLILLAVVDCVSFNVLGYGAALVFGAAALPIVGFATLGAVLAGAYGLHIATSLPFKLAPGPLVIAILALLVGVALFFAPNPNALLAAVLSGVSAGAISLAALLKLWTIWKLPEVSEARPKSGMAGV